MRKKMHWFMIERVEMLVPLLWDLSIRGVNWPESKLVNTIHRVALVCI